MFVHELTRTECEEVLARATVARLACVRGDQPYIVPIHVAFDGYHLYSLSTVGQKVDWMREHPKVCVEIEEISDPRRWTTVLVFGRFEEITRAPDHREARAWAEKLLEPRFEYWIPATARSQSHEPYSPVVYRIRMESVTGRRAERE